MMKLSLQGAAFIRRHEGFRARWYRDPVGIWTIGIGFTWRSTAFREWWRANKSPVQDLSLGMTEKEADDALRFLVQREYGAAVNRFLGKDVPQHVFDAMCSVTFNLGARSLQWKWAQAAKAGDYATAAEQLKVTGTTAGGKRLRGLVKRRAEEARLLETGSYN